MGEATFSAALACFNKKRFFKDFQPIARRTTIAGSPQVRRRSEKADREVRIGRVEGRTDRRTDAELTYFRKLTAKGRRAAEEESSYKHTNAAVGRIGGQLRRIRTPQRMKNTVLPAAAPCTKTRRSIITSCLNK